MEANHFGQAIFCRVVLWGLGGGSVPGGIYGPLNMTIDALLALLALLIVLGFPFGGSVSLGMVPAWLIASFLVGLIVGGLTGLCIGLIDGSLLSITAQWTMHSHSQGAANIRGRTLSVISAVTGGVGGFVMFMWSGPPIPTYQGDVARTWFQTGVSAQWFLWVVVPALIAGCYGWWVGNGVTVWVARTGVTLDSLPRGLYRRS